MILIFNQCEWERKRGLNLILISKRELIKFRINSIMYLNVFSYLVNRMVESLKYSGHSNILGGLYGACNHSIMPSNILS